MIGFLTNWARNKALKIMDSRTPDFVIGPPDDPYMLRWWAIPRNHFFNIYIHRIRHDDDDRALHDHPWPSLSLCVEGGIHELYSHGFDDFGQRMVHSRVIKQGAWVYRSGTFAHRLELLSPGGASTIFMTGPRIREWGFLCPQGWRHWKDFVSMEHKGQAGIGCGEIGITDDTGFYTSFHCKQCGGEEISLHNYDGYCRECVEYSSYGRDASAKAWVWIAFFAIVTLTFCVGIASVLP